MRSGQQDGRKVGEQQEVDTINPFRVKLDPGLAVFPRVADRVPDMHAADATDVFEVFLFFHGPWHRLAAKGKETSKHSPNPFFMTCIVICKCVRIGADQQCLFTSYRWSESLRSPSELTLRTWVKDGLWPLAHHRRRPRSTRKLLSPQPSRGGGEARTALQWRLRAITKHSWITKGSPFTQILHRVKVSACAGSWRFIYTNLCAVLTSTKRAGAKRMCFSDTNPRDTRFKTVSSSFDSTYKGKNLLPIFWSEGNVKRRAFLLMKLQHNIRALCCTLLQLLTYYVLTSMCGKCSLALDWRAHHNPLSGQH